MKYTGTLLLTGLGLGVLGIGIVSLIGSFNGSNVLPLGIVSTILGMVFITMGIVVRNAESKSEE